MDLEEQKEMTGGEGKPLTDQGGNGKSLTLVLETCMICGESFTDSLVHFTCPNSPAHTMCAPFFADYVNHCCECWATLNTIPVKCQMPDCQYFLPDQQLKHILQAEIIAPRNLWEKYSQIQLKAALEKADKHAQEVPVTCAFCGKYSEFYVKAAPNYWEKAERDRFKARAEKEQAVYEKTKRLQDEMERKLQELEQKRVEEGKDEEELHVERATQEINRLEGLFALGQNKVTALRANFGESPWEIDSAVELLPNSIFLESEITSASSFNENENLDPDVWSIMKTQLEQQLTALRRFINEKDSEIAGLREKIQKVKDERTTKLKADMDQKRKDMLDQIIVEIEDKLNDEVLDEKVDTSQYFVCRNLFCDGAYCLKCECFIKKPELGTHFCSVDPVDKLYNRVIETLAVAATRTCPDCGASGMKDLACTHITCDKCHNRFCYVCGISEMKLGDFGVHNEWNINTPPEKNRCPMYLNCKWGDGSPEQALENFHRELQIKAIEQLKKEVNNDKLWDEIVEKKFGGKQIVQEVQYYDPAHPYIPRETPLDRFLRRRTRFEHLLVFFLALTGVLYCLYFLCMYTWMIHAGRVSMNQPCSQNGLAKFAIAHGSLAWSMSILFCIGACLNLFTSDDKPLIPGGFGMCIFVAMFGTFVWGAVMFYKTNAASCTPALYTCLHVYFLGTWITSGVIVFCILFSYALAPVLDALERRIRNAPR